MRKPSHEKTCYAICEQQRRRSAYASVQSDQRLCFRCLDSNTSSFYIHNFKPLPSFCGCSGQFESTLVENPEDRFSCDVARISIGPGHAKTCLMPYANNKGADQPAHPRSLISTFVVRCLDGMRGILAIQSFKILASFCSWTGWFECYLVENPRRPVFLWRGSFINLKFLILWLDCF